MNKAIIIEVPMLPPRELSPNYRPLSIHWAVRRKPAKEFHDAVYFSARSAMATGWWHPVEKVTIKPTFVFATNRRRDPDNYIAMLKPAIDSLVDAGLLIDDDSKHVELLPPVFEVDKARAPMTILRVEGK